MALAEVLVPESAGWPAADQAALWYVLACTHHIAGRYDDQIRAADRCLAHGRAGLAPGWVSNGYSIRALAQVQLGNVEAAFTDLARSEVELVACRDDALCCWAHTGLGYGYLVLRLYELAQPHLEKAQLLDASPMPLPEGPVIDLMNLVELHLRWADELEQAAPEESSDDEVLEHRGLAHTWAERAVAAARVIGVQSFFDTCHALEMCTRSQSAAGAGLEELVLAYASTGHRDHFGGRAMVGGALARTYWRLDRREEALVVAREAASQSDLASDWQVAASLRWLLVEMEAEAGVPGAESGRAYAQLLSRVLWQQRLSTLQGAVAAVAVERLQHDTVTALRVAAEDPLTGVGNRRALDHALAALARPGSDGLVPAAVGTTLLLTDLDDFKAINDTHGHLAGDEVLRAIAGAVRSVARIDDLVARLGGDEFVVLARHTDAEAGQVLAERVATAIESLEIRLPADPLAGPDAVRPVLRLGVSVGVATTGVGVGIEDLLEAADTSMYRDKARHRAERQA